MNNQGWENNSTIIELWYDTRPQHVESSLGLQALVAQFSKETKLCIEKLERMDVLHQLQAELVQIQVELLRMTASLNGNCLKTTLPERKRHKICILMKNHKKMSMSLDLLRSPLLSHHQSSMIKSMKIRCG